VHLAEHSLTSEPKVDKPSFEEMDVVLIQRVVEALIEVFQVQKDDCASLLHADLDATDVSTDLRMYELSVKECDTSGRLLCGSLVRHTIP
jgi:hypothetical protein